MSEGEEEDKSGSPEIRFRRVKVPKIYFRDYLEQDFRQVNHMPEFIRKNRNRSIILVAVQILSAVCSLAIYVRRESRVILAASILSIILSFVGMFGTIMLNNCFMFMHAFFCTSLFGAFYVYLLIEMIFIKPNDFKQNSNAAMSDTAVMFFMSIPFMIIFLVGCHSMYLLVLVSDERKERRIEQERERGLLAPEPLEEEQRLLEEPLL